MLNEIVVVRGGGDIATGVIQKLHRSGFKVLVLEIETPMVIRRTVSFAQAIFDGETVVEGIKAVKVNTIPQIQEVWSEGNIPIMVDKDCKIINRIKPQILVDAIMAKRNLGTEKTMAPITIAIGPGFEAGVDADIVIESNRGHDLGKLIFEGYAETDTGIPGNVGGYSIERVIKAPCDGQIKNLCKIGDIVRKDQVVAEISGTPVKSKIDGVLRGIIKDDIYVKKGLKIGDVDPRGIEGYCYTISEKARAIGGGVLEAILYMYMKRMKENGIQSF